MLFSSCGHVSCLTVSLLACLNLWWAASAKRVGRSETLTCVNQKEELGLSSYWYVLGGRVVDQKLAVVAVSVAEPQLRDGHVQSVAAGVSADAGAVPVGAVEGRERVAGVHVQHVAAAQPAALQVNAKGRFCPRFDRTGQNHTVALIPLQELNVTENLTEANTSVTIGANIQTFECTFI